VHVIGLEVVRGRATPAEQRVVLAALPGALQDQPLVRPEEAPLRITTATPVDEAGDPPDDGGRDEEDDQRAGPRLDHELVQDAVQHATDQLRWLHHRR
jgi:hypothetical protein